MTHEIHGALRAREWGLPAISGSARLSAGVANQLDAWLKGTGTLLVEAPHGYGKSTQLALWLRGQIPETPVVWISENPYIGTWDDADATLVHALIRLGLVDKSLDPSHQPSVYRALKSLNESVIVVHDDFDRLTPMRTISELERAAKEFPRIRSIFLTSTNPVDSGPDTEDRVVITHRDLSWSMDFARTVLGDRAAEARGAHRLSDVLEVTGGRASAVLEFYTRPQRTVRSRDTIADFYSRWLLDRAAAADPNGEGVGLLLDLAQFIELPFSMLEGLGHPVAGRIVNILAREGLVVVRRSVFGNESVVTMSAEHRRALAPRSRSALGEAHDELHSRAAALFEQSGVYTLAAHHYAQVQRFAEAVACLSRPEVARDQVEGLAVLRAVFNEIPLDVLSTIPELLAMRVLAAHRDPMEEIQSRGDAELRLLSISPAAVSQLSLHARSLIAAASVAALVSRNRTIEAIERGRQAAADLDGVPWDEVQALGESPGLLWTMLAEAEVINCDVRRAMDLAGVASEWNQELGEPATTLRSSAVRAAVHAIEGDLESARAYIDEVLLVLSFREFPPECMPINVAIARFYIAYSELDAELMTTVSQCARDYWPIESPWNGLTAAAAAYAHLFSGRIEEAHATSRLVLQLANSRTTPLLVRHMILMVHSDTLLASGRPGEVLSLLAGVVEKPAHPFCYASRRSAAALAVGDSALAVHLTEVCVEMGRDHAGGALAAVLVRRAAASESLQLHDEADAVFASAVALLSRRPTPSAFLNVNPEQLRSLWARYGRANPVLMARMIGLTDPWSRMLDRMPATSARVASPPEKLSARELDVLEQLRQKRTYIEIAASMFVSENTVKTHVSHIYRKLRAKSRQEAVDIALKLGLLDPPRER